MKEKVFRSMAILVIAFCMLLALHGLTMGLTYLVGVLIGGLFMYDVVKTTIPRDKKAYEFGMTIVVYEEGFDEVLDGLPMLPTSEEYSVVKLARPMLAKIVMQNPGVGDIAFMKSDGDFTRKIPCLDTLDFPVGEETLVLVRYVEISTHFEPMPVAEELKVVPLEGINQRENGKWLVRWYK